jgi:hypothetical protein
MGPKVKTDFLVAQPSLASGMARLFDFYGLYDSYNLCPSTQEADALAIFSDWLLTGQDIQRGIDQFELLK